LNVTIVTASSDSVQAPGILEAAALAPSLSDIEEVTMPDSSAPLRFPATCWSRISLAADPATANARDGLARLCASYWFPVYAFIRRKGHRPESACDLTQEFFTLLLETDALASVDSALGRFRSFLLAACTHFLSNAWDRDRALKRGGGRSFISIDVYRAESRFGPEPAHDEAPERIFGRRWAIALLDQVHETLARQYHEAGKRALFDALWITLARDGGPEREPYAVIGERLRMTERVVQMAVYRLRRRYGKALRAKISETVSEPSLIDDEIRDLFTALRQ
jgi:RNA polymerase sigma-70 factor (ECF subfamily)